jgi:hypothetical protein
MSASGTKRTFRIALHMSAIGGKADMPFCTANVCFLTQSGHRPRQAKQKPRVGHDRTDFSRRGSASLTSSHFDSFRICGDSSWCMRFYMRTLGRTSRKLLRRTVCIFFDHFGQRPRTKARQMLPHLEQLVCASLFSDPEPGRNCRTFGIIK